MTNFMQDDECCSKHFHDAVVAGNVSGDVWECPECGCEWQAEDIAPNVRQWRSYETFTLIRMRG